LAKREHYVAVAITLICYLILHMLVSSLAPEYQCDSKPRLAKTQRSRSFRCFLYAQNLKEN